MWTMNHARHGGIILGASHYKAPTPGGTPGPTLIEGLWTWGQASTHVTGRGLNEGGKARAHPKK
jgi:hypothetical protein